MLVDITLVDYHRISSNIKSQGFKSDGVWLSGLNLHRFLLFYFSVFLQVLVSNENVYIKRLTTFPDISRLPEVRQKYSAMGHVFNSLLDVWRCGQIIFRV